MEKSGPSSRSRFEPLRRSTQREIFKHFEKLMSDNKGGIVDFPLRYIEKGEQLHESLCSLIEKCKPAITREELYRAALLAQEDHALNMGREVSIPLTDPEKDSLAIQRSGEFWKEPKDLLLTLAACCLAAVPQGWGQQSTGNLGWPGELGIKLDPTQKSGFDFWIFGAYNALPWFAASILGSYFSDPVSEYTGRRRALLVAATCSFAAFVIGSLAANWKILLLSRLILGVGIGAKAAIAPILESECLPSAKRGKIMVSWQVFTAVGIFGGACASYIFRDNWRHQVLSGAVPAFALMLSTFASCESPRWLIIQGRYEKAFTTLVNLRKERGLAAKELVSIHYQIQVERWIFSRKIPPDDESAEQTPYKPLLPRTSYRRRLYNMIFIPRIRRAATAAMVVMLSQQLSGINIIAFLATNFFSKAGLSPSQEENDINSYKLAVAFGCVNMVASLIAYPLVESPQQSLASTERKFERMGAEHLGTNMTEPTSSSDQHFAGAANTIIPEQFDTRESETSLARAVLAVENGHSQVSRSGAGSNSSIGPKESSFPVNSNKRRSLNKSDESSSDQVDIDNLESTGIKLHTLHPQADPTMDPKERLRPTNIALQASRSEDAEANRGTSRRSSEQARGMPVERVPVRLAPGYLTLPEDSGINPLYETGDSHPLRGRRFLLLASLSLGALMLSITAFCFFIPQDPENPSPRFGVISLFMLLFTAVYSPGAGSIPFLYCSEIFPNEGRELGMSFATFQNFFWAGVLALFVPFGIDWDPPGGHARLLGLFAGLSVFAFILVWFFVPSTNQVASLEDMSYVFGRRLRQHAQAQAIRLVPGSKVRGARLQWMTAGAVASSTNVQSTTSTRARQRGGTETSDIEGTRANRRGDASTGSPGHATAKNSGDVPASRVGRTGLGGGKSRATADADGIEPV